MTKHTKSFFFPKKWCRQTILKVLFVYQLYFNFLKVHFDLKSLCAFTSHITLKKNKIKLETCIKKKKKRNGVVTTLDK